MKALVGAFNQEKALVEAFSVIVQLHRLIDLRHYLGPCSGIFLVCFCSPNSLILSETGVVTRLERRDMAGLSVRSQPHSLSSRYSTQLMPRSEIARIARIARTARDSRDSTDSRDTFARNGSSWRL